MMLWIAHRPLLVSGLEKTASEQLSPYRCSLRYLGAPRHLLPWRTRHESTIVFAIGRSLSTTAGSRALASWLGPETTMHLGGQRTKRTCGAAASTRAASRRRVVEGDHQLQAGGVASGAHDRLVRGRPSWHPKDHAQLHQVTDHIAILSECRRLGDHEPAASKMIDG